MAPLHPERRLRGTLRALLAAGALLCLLPGHAANVSNEEIEIQGEGLTMNLNAGTRSMNDVILRQGNTLITAEKTDVSGIANGHRNATWELKGKVHIEFDGAVLDAATATVKFAENRLQTINVQGAQAAPAAFSHVLKSSGQRVQGRAGRIDYNAGTSLVQFNGGTAFEYGTLKYDTKTELTYNLKDSTVNTPKGSRSEGSYRPTDKPVPPPRTPDRASAQ